MAINELIQEHFPKIEKTIFDYVSSVLENGKEDFNCVDDVYESVGEILLDVSGEAQNSEQEIFDFCTKVLKACGGYVFRVTF